MNQRYFLRLSFDGTNYHGWQIQKNAVTIQEVFNKALSGILKERVSTVGCGRTDTGVHANEFFLHFDSGQSTVSNGFIKELSNNLPGDIRAHGLFPAVPNAHARHDAVSRTYRYLITPVFNPAEKNKSLYYYTPIDVTLLNKACGTLFEYDDFSCFCKVHTQVATKTCKITEARWEKNGDGIIFTISANRFLRGMVRSIVGTCLDLNKGKITIEDFRKIIESKDRTKAGPSVDACGLYLTNVTYPENIFLKTVPC